MNQGHKEKLLYIGLGIGFVTFILFGFVPGWFLGGVMGLNFAGTLLGLPVKADMLARVFVAMGMALGIMFSALICLAAGSVFGWGLGKAIDSILKKIRHPVAATNIQ